MIFKYVEWNFVIFLWKNSEDLNKIWKEIQKIEVWSKLGRIFPYLMFSCIRSYYF